MQSLGDEIKELRGERHKVYSVPNDPSHRAMRARCKPVHYLNHETGCLEDIDISLVDDGTNLISSKNKTSVGFRKDGNLSKFLGIRPDNNTDTQFELSIDSIIIDGKKININKFDRVEKSDKNNSSIKHELSDIIELFTQVHECYTRTAIKLNDAVDDISISFEINIKGFECLSISPDTCGRFNFISQCEDKLWINLPKMWNDTDVCMDGIDHTLQYINDRLIYTKSLNAIGRDWIANNPGPYYIDADIYYGETTDGLTYSQAITWAGARDKIIPTQAIDSLLSNANAMSSKYDKFVFYYVYRSWFEFDTSTIGVANDIVSASVNIRGYLYNGDGVLIQNSIQADGVENWTHDAFDGEEFGHLTSWDITGYNQIPFNFHGRSCIQKGGTTKICAREYKYDFLNVTPDDAFLNGCYYSDSVGTDYDPYLEVIFSVHVEIPTCLNSYITTTAALDSNINTDVELESNITTEVSMESYIKRDCT
jgi:hypothetical protein